MKRFATLLLLLLIISVCISCKPASQSHHKTITAKIVAEYDPDTPAPLAEAKLKLPLGNALGWPEANLEANHWIKLYRVLGKYSYQTTDPNSYQLWLAPGPGGLCYKTRADKSGMIYLIEGPYGRPKNYLPVKHDGQLDPLVN